MSITLKRKTSQQHWYGDTAWRIPKHSGIWTFPNKVCINPRQTLREHTFQI